MKSVPNNLQRETCLLISRKDLYHRLSDIVGHEVRILHASYLNKADHLLRIHDVSCIMLHVPRRCENSRRTLEHLDSLYPQIPLICIIEANDIETACLCGQFGALHVISDHALASLNDCIVHSMYERHLVISWESFGIEFQSCSPLIQRALEIIRGRYLNLRYVSEVADDLGVSVEYLSSEFKKYCHIGMKRVLMTLKTMHAIRLIGNPGLSLKEIGFIVGYPSSRQFSDCFTKITGEHPAVYRAGSQ